MKLDFEALVRPYQTPNVRPTPVTGVGVQSFDQTSPPPKPVHLEIGKSGSGQSFTGSVSISESYYVDKHQGEIARTDAPEQDEPAVSKVLEAADSRAMDDARSVVIERVRDPDNLAQYTDVVTPTATVTRQGSGPDFQRVFTQTRRGSVVEDENDRSDEMVIQNEDDLRAAKKDFQDTHKEKKIIRACIYRTRDMQDDDKFQDNMMNLGYFIVRDNGEELEVEEPKFINVKYREDVGPIFKAQTEADVQNALFEFRRTHEPQPTEEPPVTVKPPSPPPPTQK